MDIGPKDTEPTDIDVEHAQPTFVHHSSLNRNQLFSPAIVDMLYSLSHHGLLIEKTYNINCSTHLQSSVSINIIPTDGI